MNYEKKLKLRLYLGIGYIAIGMIITVLNLSHIIKNEYFSAFGFALIAVGIARIRKYKLITRNEESIRRQRISETDERNIEISKKAKSVAFGTYIIIACMAIIILGILGKNKIANIFAYSVCALTLIYWLAYLIIGKKS